MARPGALGAEVLNRFDEPGAEVHLPEAIDRDPGSQRVIRRHQPLGEAQAVIAGMGRQRRQGRGQTGRHLRAFLVVFAAEQNVCRSRRSHFFHDHGGGDGLPELLAFALQPPQLLMRLLHRNGGVMEQIV